MAPTEAALQTERTAFKQRVTELKQIADVEERLKELEKDQKSWTDKYMRRLRTLDSTIKTTENTDASLEVLQLLYEDVWQSEDYLQDICTIIKDVKSKLKQDTSEIASMKRQFSHDFEKISEKCHELRRDILSNRRQARRVAREEEYRRQKQEQEEKYRRIRLEQEAAIAKALQAQADSRKTMLEQEEARTQENQQGLCEVEQSRFIDREFSMEDREVQEREVLEATWASRTHKDTYEVAKPLNVHVNQMRNSANKNSRRLKSSENIDEDLDTLFPEDDHEEIKEKNEHSQSSDNDKDDCLKKVEKPPGTQDELACDVKCQEKSQADFEILGTLQMQCESTMKDYEEGMKDDPDDIKKTHVNVTRVTVDRKSILEREAEASLGEERRSQQDCLMKSGHFDCNLESEADYLLKLVKKKLNVVDEPENRTTKKPRARRSGREKTRVKPSMKFSEIEKVVRNDELVKKSTKNLTDSQKDVVEYGKFLSASSRLKEKTQKKSQTDMPEYGQVLCGTSRLKGKKKNDHKVKDDKMKTKVRKKSRKKRKGLGKKLSWHRSSCGNTEPLHRKTNDPVHPCNQNSQLEGWKYPKKPPWHTLVESSSQETRSTSGQENGSGDRDVSSMDELHAQKQDKWIYRLCNPA